MTKRLVKLIVVAVCFCCSVQAQDEQPVAPPKPFGPVPTAAQMAWQQMEMSFPAYNETFLQTLQSALTQYGPIYEQWFDGANGEGPNGKRQVYDWPAFNGQVYKLQPNAVIFSDAGPGCRWMGNEQGVNGRTC